MAKRTFTEDPTILEAVDNLSSMAELDLEELKQDQQESEEGAIRLRSSRWLDPKDEKKTITSVKSTFKTVHKYLQHIYTKEGKQFKSRDMQKGVQSIIALANEAAKKIDECSQFFQEKGSITETKEYVDLMAFYDKKILKRFEEVLKSEEEWEEEWGVEQDAADIKRRGLKDLETVTRDRDYELFFITKEDGSSFYNKNLVRHIRLVADFDQLIGNMTGEDPLLRVKTIQDKDMQISAKKILDTIRPQLNKWIQKAGKHRDDPFIQVFYRSIMALMLAANHRNAIGQTTAKQCLSYFVDFQTYLRLALNNVDYTSFIENPPDEMDPFIEDTIELIHKVAFHLLLHRVDQADGLALFNRIVAKNPSKSEKSTRSSLSLWNEVLDDHEKLHSQLQKYPSGPLFKVLDILHDAHEENFDPYLQEDRPSHLYMFQYLGKPVNVVQMACPTKQKHIDKASIIPEFSAALRHASKKADKILLLNFQDRTSWKEFARCKAIEEYQKQAEVRKELDVVTLPKTTDFYLQSEDYIRNNNAGEFCQVLLEQIKSEEACGFYFPRYFDRKELFNFCKIAIVCIHTLFFGKKVTLSRKNRLDFIEIFYHLLYLKALLLSDANYLVFSSKDTVDQAAISAATFYAFGKIMSGEFEWKEEEKDFFVSTLFLPSLLIRERAVEVKALSRQISMLSVLSGELEIDRKKVHKEIDKLFCPNFSDQIHVRRDT